ncbi:MAG: NnrS family protein [Proteobacteria bacterium]|nr:NnrS family protein [Pseudomonadota bacterium]
MALLQQLEEPPRASPKGFALFALGFRPFYLLASIFAALSIPLWALQFSGLLPRPYLSGPVWHAHEMLFGFTLAVIVGFLFTAGRNWTNLPTPTGWKLCGLAALWVLARVLVLTPYTVAAAVVNVAFPLAAALGLAVPFIKARNRRNYFFIALLVLFALVAALIHLTALGVLAMPAWAGLQVALDIVLFIIVVMGGRVIPMFTNNGVPGTSATRKPFVETVALGSVLVLLAADAVGLQGWPVAAVATVACVAHLWRWGLWQPWKTLRTPLVWVLHLAYLWVPIHLLLRAISEVGLVTSSLSAHALTVGAAGGLIIGMMTRTAKGHTGRLLRTDRFDTTAYVLVLLAAVVRVGLPLLAPGQILHAILVSAALWSAGFGLYAWRYWPVLTRPRIDGRPG